MLARRVIPCLDVDDGRVVKGTSFVNLRDAGDPVELAVLYDQEGADEVVFLDIAASRERRGIMETVVRRTAEVLTIPFTSIFFSKACTTNRGPGPLAISSQRSPFRSTGARPRRKPGG